jgi:hypothetical protein
MSASQKQCRVIRPLVSQQAILRVGVALKFWRTVLGFPAVRISGNRCGLSRGLAKAAALVCLCAAGAGAQTAHFSGAINTLSSGFNGPEGVAVDGSGNQSQLCKPKRTRNWL